MPRAHLYPLLAVAACAAAPAAAAPIQWTAAAGGNGHWYEAMLVPTGIGWLAAQADAVSRGGYLATATSGGENDFIYALVSGNPAFWPEDSFGNNGIGPWLGGLQAAGATEPGGGWGWVTGEPWSFTNWNAGEPNNSNGGTEAYLHYFWPRNNGVLTQGPLWNDLAETIPLGVRGYIVEWDNAVPVPATAALLGLGLLGLAAPGRRRRAGG